MNWIRLFASIRKEVLIVLKDKRARTTLIVSPILQLLLFGLATTLEVRNIDIGLVNRDSGHGSEVFIARLAGSPNVRQIIRYDSETALASGIDHREVIAGILIDQRFSADIAARRPAAILATFDGRRSNAAQIVASYLDRIAGDFGVEIRGKPRGEEVIVSVTHWFNPNLDYLWFTLPSMIGVITAVLVLSVSAQSVARERERGTFEQLMVLPLEVHEIIMAKLAPAFLVGFVNATLYAIVIPLFYGVPFTGSVGLFYVSLLAYVLALVGIGLLISSLAQNQQQAFLGMFLIAVPIILLSGYASPVDNMPPFMQIFANADPAMHFLYLVEGLFLKDLPYSAVLSHFWPLLVIAFVSIGASTMLFRARME
jgi:ABC-2 type transport system permease protein